MSTHAPPHGHQDQAREAARTGADPGAHTGHQAQTHDSGWGTAARATAHCLTGCAIGEVLGFVIGTALGWSDLATIALAVALAFLFGYALTMWSVLRAGLSFGAAAGVALTADTVSITVMEIVDNAAMLVIPGAMEAGVGDVRFWASLALALVVAFAVTLPINRWMIGRGLGHARAHDHMGH